MMYTDEDLDSAIQAGVFDTTSVEAFRRHVETNKHTRHVDEENFRLISGFNDVFVVIASFLFLISVGWLLFALLPPLGGLSVVIIAWWLSIHFVLKRRLALPAILFLIAYVIGLFFFIATLIYLLMKSTGSKQGLWEIPWLLGCTLFLTMIGTWLHWRKFKVPITVAAGVGCLLMWIAWLLLVVFSKIPWMLLMVGGGCLTFGIAMFWDIRDTQRTTKTTDIAFWLHLMAAPLLVHPVFSMFDFNGQDDVSLMTIGMIVMLYVVLSFVSILIDRRALMISALVYVIGAFAHLFESWNGGGVNLAISGVIIGGMLILLSSFWHAIRWYLLRWMPSLHLYVPTSIK